MASEPHPIAVLVARITLVLVGSIILSVGSIAYFSGVDAAKWVWLMTFLLGIFSFGSAFWGSAIDVVAGVIILVYPFD